MLLCLIFLVSEFLEHHRKLPIPFQVYGGLTETTLRSVLGTVATGYTKHVVVEGDEEFVTSVLRVSTTMCSLHNCCSYNLS